MWWSPIRIEVRNFLQEVLPSMLDKTLVQDSFSRLHLHNNPSVKFSRNQKQLITAVLTRIPEEAIMVFFAHLDGHVWERSALNPSLLGSKELQVGYVPSRSTGLWQTYLHNTVDVCKEVAKLVVRTFEARLRESQEVAVARPKDQELVAFQAAASLYLNWLLPEVRGKEPWAEGLLKRLWEDSSSNDSLVQDLYSISQNKVSSAFATTMTYRRVVMLSATLQVQKAVAGPMSNDQTRHVAEVTRIEFAALQQQVRNIQ